MTNSVERLEGIDALEPRVTSGRLVVEYDSTAVSEAKIRERVRAAGYEIESGATECTFSVPDMDCASCASKVENALESTDDVSDVETRPTSGRVTVTVNEYVGSATIVDAIEGSGYDASPIASYGDICPYKALAASVQNQSADRLRHAM